MHSPLSSDLRSTVPCLGCSLMLDGVRVVDCTTEIAGPYCSKLLADAAPTWSRWNRSAGDPLRHWGSGALFEYLNTSKRSVRGDASELATSADILVSEEPVDTAALWAENPVSGCRRDHAVRLYGSLV